MTQEEKCLSILVSLKSQLILDFHSMSDFYFKAQLVEFIHFKSERKEYL